MRFPDRWLIACFDLLFWTMNYKERTEKMFCSFWTGYIYDIYKARHDNNPPSFHKNTSLSAQVWLSSYLEEKLNGFRQ